jgi:hypothetical protein
VRQRDDGGVGHRRMGEQHGLRPSSRGEGASAGTVDEGRLVAARGRPLEEERRERHLGDRERRLGGADDYGGTLPGLRVSASLRSQSTSFTPPTSVEYSAALLMTQCVFPGEV